MTETTTVRAEADTTQPSTNGHDSKGRFATGNKGGPGNPFARQVAALRQALLNCVTHEDIKEHARKLNEKAKSGDVAATKLLWQYTLGKPTPTPNPDQLDVDEWRNLRQSSCPPAEMSAIFNGFPANVANELTKACWPSQLEMNFGKAFRHGIQKMDERDARKAAKAKTPTKAAPSTNGSKGEPQAAGIVPLPNVATSELDAYFMQHLERVRPSTNVSNGTPKASGVAPLPNDLISELDDYLIQQLMRQKPSTNDRNGDSAADNRKRQG